MIWNQAIINERMKLMNQLHRLDDKRVNLLDNLDGASDHQRIVIADKIVSVEEDMSAAITRFNRAVRSDTVKQFRLRMAMA